MGRLTNGKWEDVWYDTKSTGGKFERSTTAFRNWVTPDGKAGPSGEGGFQAESGRYHLYVSLACPWAHRTLIFRKLKGLDEHISVSCVHPWMLSNGWEFRTDFDAATGDDLFGSKFLYEVYTRADPNISGRVTVPVLWDKKRNTIVSNESSEIIRMFNSAFNDLTGNADDYWPEELRDEIDTVNERVYNAVNNGVYKSGFATTQDAYDAAVVELFESLDWLEDLLSKKRYLLGCRITEADWRLFTTLIRFDPVYHGHFKCNKKKLCEYPNLWAYTRELYQWAGVKETVHFPHITQHYYYSHETINPHRVVPVGPDMLLDEPHGRDDS